MNQCDINYRQSSNKRLLVELTLIEIAQITQPDDGVSAGRRPKRLKSLFKTLIQQSQPKTAAPQVAVAEPAASTPAQKEREEQSNPRNPSNPRSASDPRSACGDPRSASGPSTPSAPKLGNIGFSWSNLRGKSSKMNIIPGSIDGKDQQAAENHSFTQEDLELQWLSMCNRMPQQYSGIAARMKNMNPIITEIPQIEVTVDNELIKQEMQNIYKSILKTLKIYLHNDEIALTILVSDKPASQKVLTRREQFEEMSQKNPAVEALRQAFDLELA